MGRNRTTLTTDLNFVLMLFWNADFFDFHDLLFKHD
jgi:hypothetical protein